MKKVMVKLSIPEEIYLHLLKEAKQDTKLVKKYLEQDLEFVYNSQRLEPSNKTLIA